MFVPHIKYTGHEIWRWNPKHKKYELIERIPDMPIWRMWIRGYGWHTTY